jgi:hypothetical protein
MPVAFEIDGVDVANQAGWSVLVRGTLHHADPDAADFRNRFDPQPWLGDDRDAWLSIEPFEITGRRIVHEGAAAAPAPERPLDGTGVTTTGLSRGECLALLRSAEYGHLTLTRNALPSVVPARYVVGEHDELLIHAATGGDGEASRTGEIVTFHVDAFEDDRRAGWSVSVTGVASAVDADDASSVSLAPWLPAGTGTLIALSTNVIWGQAFAPKRRQKTQQL